MSAHRFTAPTDAEVDAHLATGGAWSLWLTPDAPHPSRRSDPQRDRDTVIGWRRAPPAAFGGWVPVDAMGAPCAWPTLDGARPADVVEAAMVAVYGWPRHAFPGRGGRVLEWWANGTTVRLTIDGDDCRVTQGQT